MEEERDKFIKKYLVFGSLSLFFAIASGAFGAHALKNLISKELLATYQTAVDYHYYISFSFLLFGCIAKLFNINNCRAFYFLIAALFLFSGNLYLYVFSGLKIFAMLVPLGGISFMLAVLSLFFKLLVVNSRVI